MRFGKFIEEIPTLVKGVSNFFDYRVNNLHIAVFDSLTTGQHSHIGKKVADEMENRRVYKKNSQPNGVHRCNHIIYSSIAEVLNEYHPGAQPQSRLNTILQTQDKTGMPELEKPHGVENYDLQRFEYIAKNVSDYFLRNPATEEG